MARLPSLSSFPQCVISGASKSGKDDHHGKQECPPSRFTPETVTSVMTLVVCGLSSGSCLNALRDAILYPVGQP